MNRIFGRKMWMRILALVLALSLNLGVMDGVVRYAVNGTALADFEGFLKGSEAKDKSEAKESSEAQKGRPDKNKNKLPETAWRNHYKNSRAEEAKSNNEISSKRTVNSKTFKIGESEYRTEVYQQPVHFFNEKNQLTDIDNTLIKSETKGFAFENKANAFKVRFTDKTRDQGLGQLRQKDFYISWGLIDGQEAAGIPAKNTITYRGISKDADLKYVIEGSKVKEEIILNSPDTQAEYKFAINLKNLEYKPQPDGSINFTDREGSIIWNMPKPFMYDAAGEVSKAVTAQIEEEQGQLVLTVKADEQWINSAARKFPVVVDPTLQPGERFGRDTFISEQESDASFDSEEFIYVGDSSQYGDTTGFFFFRDLPREENMTITDAAFSLYAKEGNLSSVKLQEVLADWVWDYSVLTWDYWEGRKSRGEVLGAFSTTAGGSSGNWWRFNITELVQQWVDNPVKNTGFALLPQGSGYRKFISSNYGTNEREWSYHPKLVFTYTTSSSNEPQADFTMNIDRKNGSVSMEGTAEKKAKIYVTTGEGKKYTTNADSSGEWEISGLNFEQGEIKSVSMYYTYEVTVTDAEGKTHTETKTSDTTSQKFLITRYSKGAKIAKMAKLYYYDGSKAGALKQVNGIKDEMEMVVGDYVLVPDPREDRPFTGGDVITNPDEEYRLGEKLRPVYSNGEVVGDSVDAATGNFFVIETDLAFDALGMPIEFTRVMNSQEPENYRGSFGQNWHFGYEKMLVKYSDGTILATGGDGGGYFFRPSGSGYTSDDDVTDRLVKNGDGTHSIITKFNTVYHFNKDGMLDRITDSNNNSVTLTYDDEGLLRTVSDAADRTCRLSYDYMGRILMIEDPEGRQVEYDYDSWGRLMQVVDPNEGITKYEYGTYTPEGHRDTLKITRVIDPMGYDVLRNTYDDEGRVITQTDAEYYDISLEYNGNVTTFIDKNNNKFFYTFEDNYRLKSIEGPAVEAGLPAESQPANVQALKFSSAQDRSFIDPEVRAASFDASSATVSTTGSRKVLAEYHYDLNGYRDQVRDAAGKVMYFKYDDRGNLLSALDSDNKGTRYQYNDPANRNYPTDIYDAMNNHTRIEYDTRGNTRSITNAESETTYYTYKNNGLVDTVTDRKTNRSAIPTILTETLSHLRTAAAITLIITTTLSAG